MTENVPAVATGGAVVVQPAAIVQVDAAAAAVAAGAGAASGASPAPSHVSALEPARLDAIARLGPGLVRDIIIAGAFTQQDVERIAPVLAGYAPRFERAMRSRDTQGARRLVAELIEHLIKNGESSERIGWAREVIARYEPLFEGAFYGGSGNAAELHELEAMMADPSSAYWKGPEAARLQARWREIYARGESGDARRLSPPDRLDSRKAEIEQLMADQDSKYWKGPGAEALQAQYRDLITQLEQRGRRS